MLIQSDDFTDNASLVLEILEMYSMRDPQQTDNEDQPNDENATEDDSAPYIPKLDSQALGLEVKYL